MFISVLISSSHRVLGRPLIVVCPSVILRMTILPGEMIVRYCQTKAVFNAKIRQVLLEY